ncbi:MAG: DUF3991 and toprim domain-containing protein [Pseudoflavonifractor sp.]|nr:DUF3991 and toprim domain-containing protein [Pseudoflavonifractor sp.]
MPISRNGKTYFTNAQYRIARAYSALEYARAAKYSLVKDGNCYHLQEHDSMIFTLDGKWFWNSRGYRGGALEFMQFYEGQTLPEAVNMLASGRFCGAPPSPPAQSQSEEKKPFELPEKAPSFKRLFSYLLKTRKLDSEIVQRLVEEHRIYESVRRYPAPGTGEVREVHNVVFVGFDSRGQPRSAYQRGTNTHALTPFKRDVAGSDKRYAFCCAGRSGVTAVSVFEASIDAISHATLAKISGGDWRDRDRVALGGVAPPALIHYLQERPQVRQIQLCLDSDGPGIAAAEKMKAELLKAGYAEVVFCPPPTGKDWNDYLVEFRQILEQGDAKELSAALP